MALETLQFVTEQRDFEVFVSDEEIVIHDNNISFCIPINEWEQLKLFIERQIPVKTNG